MAGNDDIDYLLENRQLLLVHVEPFPAMAKGWQKRSGNRSVLVTVQDAIDKERANYQAGLINDRDLLLDYMANNMARTFFIDGREILEPELVAQRKQDEIPDKPLLCAMLAVFIIIVVFAFKHGLMFAEAMNNQ